MHCFTTTNSFLFHCILYTELSEGSTNSTSVCISVTGWEGCVAWCAGRSLYVCVYSWSLPLFGHLLRTYTDTIYHRANYFQGYKISWILKINKSRLWTNHKKLPHVPSTWWQDVWLIWVATSHWFEAITFKKIFLRPPLERHSRAAENLTMIMMEMILSRVLSLNLLTILATIPPEDIVLLVGNGKEFWLLPFPHQMFNKKI